MVNKEPLIGSLGVLEHGLASDLVLVCYFMRFATFCLTQNGFLPNSRLSDFPEYRPLIHSGKTMRFFVYYLTHINEFNT